MMKLVFYARIRETVAQVMQQLAHCCNAGRKV